MTHNRIPFGLLVVLAPLLDATMAHADVAAPATYKAEVTGNQVMVCPQNYGPSCPAPGGMLRVEIIDGGTGGVAKLPDFCQAPPSSLNVSTSITSCYVDECVPAGTYQYGFTTPLNCSSSSSGDDAIVVTVADSLSSGCTSDAGPLTDAGAAPWDPSTATGGSVPATNCHYGSDAGSFDAAASQDSGQLSDASPLHPTPGDAGRIGTPDASEQDSGASDASTHSETTGSTGSSCSVAFLGETQNKVITLDGLALAFGLVALGRRRSKKQA